MYQTSSKTHLIESNKGKDSDHINIDQYDDELFNDWSLDQSTTNRKSLKPKLTFDSINDSDENDENDFENYETLPSTEDDEESDKVKWISSDVHDDGPEYRDKQFAHTQKMLERFHALFGLKKFRSNQQEAVNCALERRYHVFVLMPTGK